MKTLFTSVATAAIISFSTNANCQTTVSLKDAASLSPAIAGLKIINLDIKPAENGFKVSWEANNQFQVARFELQLSEDNKNFSTVKRRTSPPSVNGRYEAVLNNTIILSNPVYYRLKVVSLDGQEAFTESYRVRTEG
jgi:hypothetical protein